MNFFRFSGSTVLLTCSALTVVPRRCYLPPQLAPHLAPGGLFVFGLMGWFHVPIYLTIAVMPVPRPDSSGTVLLPAPCANASPPRPTTT